VAERPDERQQILDLAAESHASALSIVAGLLGDLERSERYKIKLLGKLATLDRQHAASQAELAYTKSWAHAAGGNLNHMDGVAVELRAHLAEVERERDEAREREERWMMAVTHGPCKCDPPGSGEELCSGGCYLREERDALARELGAAREAMEAAEAWMSHVLSILSDDGSLSGRVPTAEMRVDGRAIVGLLVAALTAGERETP
jgi:hypothetical protein